MPDGILGPEADSSAESANTSNALDAVGGAGGVGDSPALTKQSKSAALIARVDNRIRKRATAILDGALRAPELAEMGEIPKNPDGSWNPPPGWTKKQLRIASDAMRPMKAAPAYLGMAARVVESYRKSEAEKPQAPTINAEVVQVHVSVANYPRRRLSED